MSEKYTFPVNQLLTYGDCREYSSDYNEWPDYLELGFTDKHIPQLIQMVTDDELDNADSDSPEVWAPIHAWRTLGQLGSEEAITPLMSIFWRVEDCDEWFDTEIPYVFGMIGEKAIKPLTDFLFEEDDSDLCSMACSCLREIGKRHPAVRDNCIAVLTQKLERFEANGSELNALIISDFIDMKIVESLPVIKKAFEKECVDYTIQGDYEDVEIYMGVRKKRSTPANYHGIL